MSANNPEHYQNCTCQGCYEECEVCGKAYPALCECMDHGDHWSEWTHDDKGNIFCFCGLEYPKD